MLNKINVSYVPDVNRFFEIIDACKKPVLVDNGGKEIIDLKNDVKARELIKAVNGKTYEGEMVLHVDPQDSVYFLNYMLNMALA